MKNSIIEAIENEQRKLNEIQLAFTIQGITPFDFASSGIPESYFRQAYIRLMLANNNFSFEIFLQHASKWEEKAVKTFIKTQDSILIAPQTIRDKEFRNIPHTLFENFQHKVVFLYNNDPKLINKINFLKALLIILRAWKTIAKNSLSKIKTNNMSKDLLENKNIGLRLSNKFDYTKLGELLAEVAELKFEDDKGVINLNGIDSENKFNFLKITPVSSDKEKFIETERSLPRKIFQKKMGIPRTIKLIIHEEKGQFEKTLSLDDRLKDDAHQPAFFKRFVIRSISAYERMSLSINAKVLFSNLKRNPETIKMMRTQPHFNKFFRSDSEDKIADILTNRPEIASFFLILHGVHKFFLCGSDTLKNTLPLSSNSHKKFTDDGETFIPYKMANGEMNLNYDIQGGGEIIIDCARIPVDKTIIAPRAHAHEQDFMGIHAATQFYGIKNFNVSQSILNKARTVSFRNHEVHLEYIPGDAIIAWRPSAKGNWQKNAKPPLVREIKTQKDFPVSLDLIYQLEYQEIPQKPLNSKKRKKRPVAEKSETKSYCKRQVRRERRKEQHTPVHTERFNERDRLFHHKVSQKNGQQFKHIKTDSYSRLYL